MNRISRSLLSGLLCPLLIWASHAEAATNSLRVDVSVSASILDSLSIVIANPVVAFGTVTPGTTNTAAVPLVIVSNWNLGVGETVKLYAYFDGATTALTGAVNGDTIPTSSFSGTIGGSSLTFSSTSPFTSGATAMLVYSSAVTAASLINIRTDSLTLTMDLTGQTSLHSDTYTGTMHLQAQAL